MTILFNIRRLRYVVALLGISCCGAVSAQTDLDAIMMAKRNFCGGLMNSNSNWESYWEGTFKRENRNLGKVSTQMVGVMGAYGITNKLNVLFGVPYVKTKASAGTLSGMSGMQDLSLWVKYRPVKVQAGKGRLSLFTMAGYSVPTTNYVADFMPLSIGLHSTNVSLRGMVDYELGTWFATVSATYIVRTNITIDRDSYYTTQLNNTNEVAMPNAAQYNFRVGYRKGEVILEGVLNKWETLGGHDISKNNMPFPSNNMDATTAGVNVKLNFKQARKLSLSGGGAYTIAGRNVGQSMNYNAGVFYVLDFASPKKTADNASFNIN